MAARNQPQRSSSHSTCDHVALAASAGVIHGNRGASVSVDRSACQVSVATTAQTSMAFRLSTPDWPNDNFLTPDDGYRRDQLRRNAPGANDQPPWKPCMPTAATMVT